MMHWKPFTSAFTFARRQYDQLLEQGIAFDHQWCGVSQLAFDDKSRGKIEKMLHTQWPVEFAEAMSREQLSELAGLDCAMMAYTILLAVGSALLTSLTH